MKYAFITGASRGIGEAIARRLNKEGYAIAVGFFRSRKRAGEICDEFGGDSFPVKLHAGDVDSIAQAFEEVGARFGKLDAFVSNAASGVLKPITEIDQRGWNWTMDINARALLFGAQHAAKIMNDGGSMIALTSAGSTRVLPNYAAVGASKAALESLVRYLAIELSPQIRVNAISPGVVDTDALKHFPNRDELIGHLPPAGRLVTPEDVAEVAAFLCSPQSEMIRGQVLVIDGGSSLVLS